MSLDGEIKYIRQKAFLSQESFANELGVSVATINRWENGKVRPNITAMRKIKAFCEGKNLPSEILEKEWLEHSMEE